MMSHEGDPRYEQVTLKAPGSAREMVKEFLTAFNHNPSDELCLDLIREEVKEAAEAAEHLLKEICDIVYVVEQARIKGVNLGQLGQQTLLNIITLTGRYAEPFALVSDEAFRRVHASNMSKLVDGKPLRRADGKILKGPNYTLPSLIDLI